MRHHRPRLRISWIAGCLAIAGLFCASAARTRGQDNVPAARPPAAAKPNPAVVGSENCKICHSPPKKYPDVALICEMEQYPTWKEKDRHSIAYRSLLEERSKEMGRRLGIDVTDAKNSCVQCHGVVVPGGAQAFQFNDRDDGVSCVACHGKSDDWIKDHQFPADPRWRALTRAQKEEQKGMTDLWDPRKRVEKCVSCHIGSVAENKVLTHAMYAVGHPPLPSIETATFSTEQPRHWQYLREKRGPIQQILGYNPKRLEQTELVAVSGLVALRSTLKLLVDPQGDGSRRWFAGAGTDFANFDCAACHHELKTSDLSWRQALEEAHPPGRPTLPAWPQALVRLGLEAADPKHAEGAFRAVAEKMNALESAMTGRPFGDIAKARPIAAEIIKFLDGPLEALDAQTLVKPGQPGRVIDRAEALRLLNRIGSMAADVGVTPDYESARQLAWAARTIHRELMSDPAGSDPAAVAALANLDRRLGLTLNPNPSGKPRPVLEVLAERLRIMSDYSPDDFRKDMNALTLALPRE